jgi:hypothetical protein
VNPNLPLGKSPIPREESELPDGNSHLAILRETVAAAEQVPLSGTRLWVHRLGMLLFVFFCAVLGVVLVIFPWREEWTSNSLLIGYPGVQDFLANGFVRGLCSGLGLLDIWIGFSEAIHYHE